MENLVKKEKSIEQKIFDEVEILQKKKNLLIYEFEKSIRENFGISKNYTILHDKKENFQKFNPNTSYCGIDENSLLFLDSKTNKILKVNAREEINQILEIERLVLKYLKEYLGGSIFDSCQKRFIFHEKIDSKREELKNV